MRLGRLGLCVSLLCMCICVCLCACACSRQEAVELGKLVAQAAGDVEAAAEGAVRPSSHK